MAYNESDGSVVGKYDLYDGTNTYIPSTIRFDDAGKIIMGGMYFEGIKYRGMNSKGVFVMQSNLAGKDKKIKTLPWQGDMQRYLAKSSTNGFRIDGKNKILFEDVILHDKGIQLIGETFSKSLISLFQISDIVVGTTSGESKPVMFNVKDILIFNFDKGLEFTDMQLIRKKEINISCYPPYNGMFGLTLASKLKDLGYFNYRFYMKEDPGQENFTLISTNQGDFLDNIKKGVRYSVANIEPGTLEPEETLRQVELYDENSKIRSYGLLRNNGEKLLVYYYDPKFDAVRLYLDTLDD